MRPISDGPVACTRLNAAMASLSRCPRKVRLSDWELVQRVQHVVVPEGHVELCKLSSQRGWKRIRRGVTRGMTVHCRVLRAQSRQCQVMGGGEVRARVSELLALLRAPTESESNALLRALYGSRFIYTSLLHTIPNTERSILPSSPGPNGAVAGPQLMVRTASFAHKRLAFEQRRSTTTTTTTASLDSMVTSRVRYSSPRPTRRPKNEQCCYIEFLTPTQEGFRLSFCTLDAADVLAGKAPSDRVMSLHPISGWLIAEPSLCNPETLRVTFQAAFLGNVPGSCDARVAQGRLLFLAKGFCRLEKVLHRRRRHYRHQRTVPGRMWQVLRHPFRAMGVVDSDDPQNSGGTHRNGHCIACTRSFFPTLRKSWRRCDLCAYRVCDEPACCAHERVTIYNRYVAPLLICARCRECIDERESDACTGGNGMGSTFEDVRYTGVSLRFADRERGFRPELERDPFGRTHGTWRPARNRRSSGRPQLLHKNSARLTTCAFSSSGDDSSSPGARTQQ